MASAEPPIWSTDAKHVYSLGRRIRADSASFRTLNDVFARDDTTIFFAHGPLREADAQTFEIVATVTEPDPDGPHYGTHCYARDKASVFFHSETGRPRLLRGADPAAFRWLGKAYGADSRRVWRAGYLMAGADPATFRHLEGPYGIDRASCFFLAKRLRGAHPATFSAAECGGEPRLEFARDASRVYFRELEIPGADPASFALHKPPGALFPTASDRNRVWTHDAFSALQRAAAPVRVYPPVEAAGPPSDAKFDEERLKGLELEILTFCTVVHWRSVEQAAKEFRQVLTPETIGKRIEALQARAGATLAVYEGGRLRITADGLALYVQLGAIVSRFADLLGPKRR